MEEIRECERSRATQLMASSIGPPVARLTLSIITASLQQPMPAYPRAKQDQPVHEDTDLDFTPGRVFALTTLDVEVDVDVEVAVDVDVEVDVDVDSSAVAKAVALLRRCLDGYKHCAKGLGEKACVDEARRRTRIAAAAVEQAKKKRRLAGGFWTGRQETANSQRQPYEISLSLPSLHLPLSLGLNSHNNTAGQRIPVDSQHPITNLTGWLQAGHPFLFRPARGVGCPSSDAETDSHLRHVQAHGPVRTPYYAYRDE
ncbi:hypothetical protein TEQG_05540 [Trichophyton equinum CBS 127.97]|uniref:Uncharacterized protein n=1 Tax=Trichophyton equinum (strain ATCC MYA-4606 / CBS 127.97) TaxID=559882 RepID=F2PXC2_TRIEC|nr:hypothetical protein TEQG_05540 [Trichophyton equinum CBS 127.97]